MAKQKVQAAQRPEQDQGPAYLLLSRQEVVGLTAATILVLGIGNLITNAIQHLAEHGLGVDVDRPRAWPFSVFSVRVPTLQELLIAGAVVAFFYLARRYLARTGFRPVHVVLVGVVLVIGTNLVQGWQNGLVTPTDGTIGDWKHSLVDPFHTIAHLPKDETAGRLQYYDDAQSVRSARDFVARFNEIQPQLLTHSQTHPPGAVLVYYGLRKIVGSPAAISLAIALLSTSLSGFFFYGLLRTLQLDNRSSGYFTLLFLLLPAVQIYYAASLDALIATLLLGGLCCFVQHNRLIAIAGTAALLAGASFLTFGWAFILPVLAGWEILQRRGAWRFAAVCGTIGLLYVGLQQVSGFDYLQSFRTASAIENPKGFYLAAEPVSYILTRLECAAEILAFFGPFLLVLMWRELRGADSQSGAESQPGAAVAQQQQPRLTPGALTTATTTTGDRLKPELQTPAKAGTPNMVGEAYPTEVIHGERSAADSGDTQQERTQADASGLSTAAKASNSGEAAESQPAAAVPHKQPRQQPQPGTAVPQQLQQQAVKWIFALAAGTLLAMFVAGTFRTGETARACLFIYPYLLLPVIVYVQKTGLSERTSMQLLSLVFLQALAMQTLASFFW